MDRTDAEIEESKTRGRMKQGHGAAQQQADSVMKTTASHKRTKGSISPSASSASTAASLSTSTPTPSPHDPQSYAHSLQATEAISSQLYSNTALVVLQHLKLRDHILKWHAEMDSLPMSAEGLLEWHTQVHCMLIQIADSMHIEDFENWILGGLTTEQLNSSIFTSSPLFPWSRLSTRPFHKVIHNNTRQLHETSQPPSLFSHSPPSVMSKLDSDPNSLQLKIEFLPAANRAFRRWSEMLLTKLKFEVELKEEKRQQRQRAIQQLQQFQQQQGCATSLPSSVPSAPTVHKTPNGISVFSIPNPDGEPTQFWSTPYLSSCHSVFAATTISEDDDLADHFGTLAIGRSLIAEPAHESTEHEMVNTQAIHAIWCPRGGPQQFEEQESFQQQQKHAKKSKCGDDNGLNIHGHSDSHSDQPCICSMSTALPCRVWVNSGFHSTFGWSRSDVEIGMQTEGLRWCRRIYPPSIWRHCRLSMSEQQALTLELVAMKLIQEAHKRLMKMSNRSSLSSSSSSSSHSSSSHHSSPPSSSPASSSSTESQLNVDSYFSSSLTSPSSGSHVPSPIESQQQSHAEVDPQVTVTGQQNADWNAAIKNELLRRQQEVAAFVTAEKLAAAEVERLSQAALYQPLFNTTPFVTREGAIIAAASKDFQVEKTDGVSTLSAVIISWSIPPGVVPIPPQILLHTAKTTARTRARTHLVACH